MLQPGGCAVARREPGRDPRQGEEAEHAETRPHLRVAKVGLREPPPKFEHLLNERQLLAREDVLDAALVVQPVACRQAALAARCPSLHPKDASSCRSYIVHNDAKKLLFW